MVDILSCGLLGIVLSSTSSWAQSGQVSLPRPDGVDPGPSGCYMYPPTRRINASSIYHSKEQGTVVVDDPYRWLEKEGLERRVWAVGKLTCVEDEIYAQFHTAQDLFSTSYLHLYSGLGALGTAVQRSHNYTQVIQLSSIQLYYNSAKCLLSCKFDAPYLAHDLRWYWMARSGTQKQPVVYRSASAKLPNAGADGRQDLEAISELFFDVCQWCFFGPCCFCV
jgi:hypothetical protein